MKVLIACEFSGVVREAFRKKGHDAWSCDILDTIRPGAHIQEDALAVMQRNWDLMIAHPPCTYLCNSGVHWLHRDKTGERWGDLNEAAWFFKELWNCHHIPKICIENPVPHKYAELPKYTQTIQPWQFGHPESKRTCLWLKNLPKLEPTNILIKDGPWENQTPSGQNKLGPSKNRGLLRSITYQGIADAMAEQWG
jgi:hypothetical protein